MHVAARIWATGQTAQITGPSTVNQIFNVGCPNGKADRVLAEFVASRYRGWFTGSLAGFFSFGFVGAALLGNFIIPLAPVAWRFAVLLTAAPVLMLLWWRRALPESPRWLESRGRRQEAEAVMAGIEAQVQAERGVLPPVKASLSSSAPTKGTFVGNLASMSTCRSHSMSA